MNKIVLSAKDLLEDSFRLGLRVLEDGFKPTMIIAIWRGGTPVGMAVQEGLDFLGIKTDHIAIRTSYRGHASYSEMVSKADSIRVHGLQYLLENLCSHHSMLIVDDVYSTGSSVQAVIGQLTHKTRRNLPHDIRVATVWYRPSEKTIREPDFFVHKTNDWLVLPYELSGMSIAELREHRPELSGIIDRLEPFVSDR